MTIRTAPPLPPFRAEQIGSLLRPPRLIEAIRRRQAGTIAADELAAIQNEAIDEVIRMQEDIGLQCVTDGEFRRVVYYSYFYVDGLGGIDFEEEGEQAWRYRDRAGRTIGASLPVVRKRLRWTRPINVADFEYVRARTRREPKVTLPGPNALHFFGGREHISREAYPRIEAFFDDVIDALKREIRALAAAGCRYIQIDETALAKFGDPHIRDTLAARGDSWQELMALYIGNLNRVVAGAPPGMTIGVHLCRGNRQGYWQAEGGYDLVADSLFNRLAVDNFFMEYDSPRAGDFGPLRFLPKGKRVVLGLVSTKSPELESADALKRRIEEAAGHVDLDRLALSPQCGFASDFVGNPLTVEQQIAKLRRVVEVAGAVWG